jgi:ABC-type antimicrobial peptide transport system permease subunit
LPFGGVITAGVGVALHAPTVAILTAAAGVAIVAVVLAGIVAIGPMLYATGAQPIRRLRGE